ncbi:hypothetical protein [Flavobacterium sp. I3-2]|uniref:hypothetical protein n=1 Tax=Flavobacterium sp. I3-2 TaxID=2748319 RepID=UPI0015AEEB16|nr:hypothetical protein [Flavobacterium sp. I3-2]
MNPELRMNIRLRWLESLFELAHHEFQKKVWIEASIENYVSDFTEVVCTYFDDLNLKSGLEKFAKEGFITEMEVKIFLKFHKQFEEYVDKSEKKTLSDYKVLRDIEWVNLTKLAKENWIELKGVLTDKTEIDYVIELENKYSNVT